MARPRVEMHRLQELVRLHRLGTHVRERCGMLAMSSRSEKRYRDILARAGLLEGPVGELPELCVLKAAVLAVRPVPDPTPRESTVDRWRPQVEDAVKRGVQIKALHDKLVRTDPDYEASYSALRRAARRVRKARGVQAKDVAIAVTTLPGERAQVDFGSVGKLLDPATGQLRNAHVFVMVLSHSRMMHAEIVFDQSARTWQQLHVNAFEFFGVVPRIVVPDNLKAAVIRAAFGNGDRHLIALNRSYIELARHYGFKVDPTPVYSPEKKGKVEAGVKYVKRNFFDAFESFDDIDEANRALRIWLDKTANQRTHGSTHRVPAALFVEADKPAMLLLPERRFEAIFWHHATVHQDAHVTFQRRLYSVPWRLIGKKVWLKISDHSVLIYADDCRVATHERRGLGERSTHQPHLPEYRRDLACRSLPHWLERGEKLGEEVREYLAEVEESDDVLSKLAEIQAIVMHLERFPEHRVLGAVRRARFYGLYSFHELRRVLAKQLDLEPLPTVTVQRYGALTAPRFARNANEILHLMSTDDHQPN